MTSTYSCRVCSKPSYGQVHKKCQRETRFAVVEDVALTGGEWIYDRRRGVEVYVLDEAAS